MRLLQLALSIALPSKGARAFHTALYRRQLEIGSIPWIEFAHEAQVPDTSRFSRCLGTGSDSLIASGTRVANALNVTGTPTAVVNGWLVEPSLPENVEKAVNAVLAGKSIRTLTPR